MPDLPINLTPEARDALFATLETAIDNVLRAIYDPQADDLAGAALDALVEHGIVRVIDEPTTKESC